jgi:hypothetical protein
MGEDERGNEMRRNIELNEEWVVEGRGDERIRGGIEGWVDGI